MFKKLLQNIFEELSALDSLSTTKSGEEDISSVSSEFRFLLVCLTEVLLPTQG